MSRVLMLTLAVCLFASTALAQTREEKVRNDRKKVEADGFWIYNDLPKALAEAKQSGKPIVAVLRCIPCEECVKLDDDLLDADKRVKPLLEQFVRVRIVSTNGLDLSLFQFDTDQSFAVFLINADGTIYGRFGTRSHRTSWQGDVSVEGLAKALEGALELHRDYPKNKEALAKKRGPAPLYDTPEKFPTLKARYKSTLDEKGKIVPSCIHCHQIGDAVRDLAMKDRTKLTDALLFPHPHPKSIGLILDPRERATVSEVAAKSAAAKAGFTVGDVIAKLDGQPLLSIADVQWVLHGVAAEGGTVKAEVLRDGKPVQLTLALPKGWRQRDDIGWRASTWGLRRVALGGTFLLSLPEAERKKLEVGSDATALLVQHVGQFAPHDRAHRAGVRKGDVLIGLDERTDLLRETDLIVYALREKKPGEKLTMTLLRNGKKQMVSFELPQ